MHNPLNQNANGGSQLCLKSCLRRTGGVVAALGLLCAAPVARADEPVTMAPPVSQSQASEPAFSGPGTAQDVEGTPVNTSQNSVFNWAEIPQDQRVPLTRAAFDQGGYQLYDTVGETIVVPFANQNLYVMKFAVSPDNTLFFENTGGAPVLYVPQNGYLANATVPGAKWYPFSEKFHPAEPVFLGIAPSYPVFVGLGWYPHTALYGGYYGRTSFVEGGIFLPSIGLSFFIGGRPYYGYTAYRDYVFLHPAPYRVGYFHRDVYRFAERPVGPGHAFYGGGHGGYAGRGFNGGGIRSEHQAFGGGHSYSGGGRAFRGAGAFNSGGHFDGGSRSSGDRSFGNGDRAVYAHRTFQGTGRSYGGGATGGRSYGGGRSFGGSRSNGGSDAGGGSRSYGSARSYGGGATGGRSYGGGHFGGRGR